MSLVIDSSMTLSWYFGDERTPARIAVLNRVADAGAIVPAHWRLEVLNGFQVAVRRSRITAAYRDASLADLHALAITIGRGTNRQAWSATLRLCDRFGLTPYDAAYLELAPRRRFPLATLDGALMSWRRPKICCWLERHYKQRGHRKPISGDRRSGCHTSDTGAS